MAQPSPLPTPYTYKAADFESWQQPREFTRPFFDMVCEQVETHLAGVETILDIGGGEGHTLDMLADDFGPRLVTVDVDERALRRLQDTYPQARTIETRAEELPFEDGSVGAAISISAFDGFRRTDAMVDEIERVLQPGGKFIFFRDLPYSFGALALHKLRGLSPPVKEQILVLPAINPTTGALDRLVPVTRFDLEALDQAEDDSPGKLALDAVRVCLGSDWHNQVYDNVLWTAALARQFTAVIDEIERRLGEDELTSGSHYRRAMRPSDESLLTTTIARLFRKFVHSSLRLTQEMVTVDHAVETPLQLNGVTISSLYVDELSNAHVVPARSADAPSATRVHGRTPVYIAHKP